jgi:hypothetical protein
MIVAGAWALGARVTVTTSIEFDLSELRLHPHTVIAEIVDGPDGRAYYVEHTDTHQPHRFGPFPRNRLLPGWR